MKLGEARRTFSRLLVDLLHWATEQGMHYAFDEVMQHQGKGHMAGSLHYSGCAADVLLYDEDSNYLTGKTIETGMEGYQNLGEKWETMHELCRWGGRFNDGGHLSFAPFNLFGDNA